MPTHYTLLQLEMPARMWAATATEKLYWFETNAAKRNKWYEDPKIHDPKHRDHMIARGRYRQILVDKGYKGVHTLRGKGHHPKILALKKGLEAGGKVETFWAGLKKKDGTRDNDYMDEWFRESKEELGPVFDEMVEKDKAAKERKGQLGQGKGKGKFGESGGKGKDDFGKGKDDFGKGKDGFGKGKGKDDFGKGKGDFGKDDFGKGKDKGFFGKDVWGGKGDLWGPLPGGGQQQGKWGPVGQTQWGSAAAGKGPFGSSKGGPWDGPAGPSQQWAPDQWGTGKGAAPGGAQPAWASAAPMAVDHPASTSPNALGAPNEDDHLLVEQDGMLLARPDAPKQPSRQPSPKMQASPKSSPSSRKASPKRAGEDEDMEDAPSEQDPEESVEESGHSSPEESEEKPKAAAKAKAKGKAKAKAKGKAKAKSKAAAKAAAPKGKAVKK